MLKVVIVGHAEMLANLIAGALDAKCKIVGVLRYETIKHTALYNNIKNFIFPETDYNYIKSYNLHEIKVKSINSNQFKKEILKLNPDIILVGTWSEKINKDILNLPKIAFINAHPALLPKYRGPNPYLEVVRHQEVKSGLSFHLMTEKYDAGAILLQRVINIEKYDTAKEVKSKIIGVVREGTGELLLNLNDDLIIPLEQNEERASYYKNITKDEVMINFKKDAEEITAHVRAFHPWYKTYFEYKNQFFTPNPYHTTVMIPENNDYKDLEAGTVIYKNHKTKELRILSGDKKIIRFVNIKLYGKIKQFFTKTYIKYFVDVK